MALRGVIAGIFGGGLVVWECSEGVFDYKMMGDWIGLLIELL